jgi:3-dehydroquinate dehydratase
LNLSGHRERGIYGSETLDEINEQCKMASNHGGLAFCGYALREALTAVDLPTAEVQLSNL